MKLKLIASLLVAAGAIAASSSAMAGAKDLNSCCAPTDQDFPKNGGNLGNQSYSSLSQIDKTNINKLGAAWMVHTSTEPATTPTSSPGVPDAQQQTTPIAVDGVVYVETPSGDVMAVDGATGAVKWKWHPTIANSGFGPTSTRRGVSVGDGKVYTLAAGNRVVALNKDTGAQVWAVVPPIPAGETTLGNIQKVATVYYDGMVYVGANDANRNAGIALKSSDGTLVWTFYGGAKPGLVLTDVNGHTIDAGATWYTGAPTSCATTGGVSTWMHPAIDPELKMVYWAIGNVRSCASSQDGSTRPGINLFSSALVAMDAKTGEYKWHFQSVHHGIWDMDNTHAPLLADVKIGGQPKKVVYYGSKQGRTFVLDRTNGLPVLGVEERPVMQDTRQLSWPTQPYPLQPGWLKDCVVYQNLGSEIPGDPNRAVPNYNGYQASPDPDHPGQMKLTLASPNYLDVDAPFLIGPGAPNRKGCMNEPHWNLPVLSTPSQNGGADWSGHSFSQNLGLYYVPYGNNPTAHDQTEGGNGLRAIGQYQTGGIVAIDGSTNLVRWQRELGLDVAHGNTPLTTATDLLFLDQSDGFVVAMDAVTGSELWRFQTGAAGSSGVISYMVGGQQYVAVLAAGTGIPYSPPGGDTLWAFKLGGTAKYKDAAGAIVSGSSEAPTPPPLTIRRPVGNTAASTLVPANTILLARSNGTATATKDSTSTGAMVPSTLRVPVGTTVTFLNPGADTFPTNPNLKPHCATQFFEGLFNPKLNPGQSFQYTFNRAGEYFYNDCTDPRPTGKVVAFLTPEDVPNALRFTPSTLNLGSANGVFTGVNGVITAHFQIPDGYTPDGEITLTTPLTTTLFSPISTNVDTGSNQLVAQFNKADVDNNIPEGDSVPLVLTVNVLQNGVQKQLTSTANVKVVK